MSQDLTAVAWLYSEAEFLHVCNGLPIQSPAAQPISPFPQLVILQCSHCRHMLYGEVNNVTLLGYRTSKAPEDHWSRLTCNYAVYTT